MNARRIAVAVQALALLAALVLAVAGVSLLPLLAVSSAVWVMLLAARWGAGLGIAASLTAAALLVLMSLAVLPVTGLPLLGSQVVIWTAAGAAGIALAARRVEPVDADRWRAAAWRWAPPALGAVIWIGAMIASVVMRSASHYSWVMMGDSANNLLFARETIYDDGIELGGDANPVPLPSAAIALAMSAGRSATAGGDLLRHDIGSFAVVWGLLIALTCYLAGAAAAVVVDPRRRGLVVVAGAGASLIPLSWFVTGYPIEYGFFNTHLALPIVFLSWIAATSSSRNPPVAFATLLGACTLMLAVWSPLVLLPLALAVLVAVRHRRELLAIRRGRLAVVLVGGLQLLAYGLVSTLPSLLAQGGFLTGVGGIIPFPRTIIALAAGGALVAGVLALLRKHRTAGLSLLAVLAGGAVGIGALLFLNRAQASPWTYYPTKLAWLMTIIFGVLALGTVLASLPPLRKLVAGVLLVVAVAGTFGALYAVGKSIPSFSWRDPVPRIVTDDFAVDDDVAEKIFALSDPDKPALLWESGDPAEGSINFWLLQMRADSTSENRELRVYAYAHDDTVEELCAIVAAMGPPVTVHTADPLLQDKVDESCGGSIVIARDGE